MGKPVQHGVYGHRYYIRWNDMVQRCYNKKDKDYPEFGEKGIKMCEEWDRRNPKGASNFIHWLDDEVHKLPEHKRNVFYVVRRNQDEDYSPQNCFLADSTWLTCKRPDVVLSYDKVIELRQYKKSNPSVSVRKMCEIFDVDHVFTLSRCLKGITWAIVDAVEPPIKDLGGRCKKVETL